MKLDFFDYLLIGGISLLVTDIIFYLINDCPVTIESVMGIC